MRFGVPFTLSRNIHISKKLDIADTKVRIRCPDEHGVRADFCTIFLDDCYGLHALGLPNNSPTIVDIGANIGLFALAARRSYPDATIHSYEPNPALEDYLGHHASQAGFIYFMEAVGAEAGKVTLVRSGDSNQTTTQRATSGRVPMVSFKDVLDRTQGRVDLLKLDCEGCEWPLLRESDSLWRAVDRVVMEYHLRNESGIDHKTAGDCLKHRSFEVIRHEYSSETPHGLIWAARP